MFYENFLLDLLTNFKYVFCQDFTIDIYLRQYWEDPRLSFPENEIQKTLTLNRQTIEEIWVPSTYFFNAKKAYFHDVTTDNYLLQIQPDGNIFYSVRWEAIFVSTEW